MSAYRPRPTLATWSDVWKARRHEITGPRSKDGPGAQRAAGSTEHGMAVATQLSDYAQSYLLTTIIIEPPSAHRTCAEAVPQSTLRDQTIPYAPHGPSDPPVPAFRHPRPLVSPTSTGSPTSEARISPTSTGSPTSEQHLSHLDRISTRHGPRAFPTSSVRPGRPCRHPPPATAAADRLHQH